MVSAPCKGCEGRFIGCHSSCGKYKKYQEDHAAEVAVIRDIKDKKNALNDFRIGQIQKAIRRGKRR